MSSPAVWLGTAALALAPIPLWAAGSEVAIAEDGMLVAGGRRLFAVGLYHYPAGALPDVAASGFNAVRVKTSDGQALDRLWRLGIRGWLHLPPLAEGGASASDAGTFAQTIAARRDHQGLLLWDQPDEALWGCWWPTLEWRRTEEPAMQRARIAALAGNRAKRLRLEERRRRADELLRGGRFGEAEALADGIWLELDGTLERPSRSLSDSPACVETTTARLVQAYEAARRVDPCHPVWLNHAPRQRAAALAAANRAADIVGCDIYPLPEHLARHSDIPEQSVAAVGAYTELMRAAAGGRPVFMAIQAFGWSDLERRHGVAVEVEKPAPTHAEMRFMAFDAIVHRARGVFFYGSFLYARGSREWGDLCLLGAELRDLQEVLAAPDADPPDLRIETTWTSEGPGVVALAKVLDGETWHLVINENREPLRYSLCGLAGARGDVVRVSRETMAAPIEAGCASLPIAGHGVQVLLPPAPWGHQGQ